MCRVVRLCCIGATIGKAIATNHRPAHNSCHQRDYATTQVFADEKGQEIINSGQQLEDYYKSSNHKIHQLEEQSQVRAHRWEGGGGFPRRPFIFLRTASNRHIHYYHTQFYPALLPLLRAAHRTQRASRRARDASRKSFATMQPLSDRHVEAAAPWKQSSRAGFWNT